jgi:multisubunit Na+/H+ antiporter MnhC subunit
MLRAAGTQVAAVLLLSMVAGISAAQKASPPPRLPPAQRAPAPPESLTVYLMTMGPGKAVWERFGHNAIWIHDPVQGTDKAYNYGLFDLRQENFLVRFLQGRMWYWMQGFPAQSYVELYRRANRSVWIQELEMPPKARRELQAFLEWNERPENRFYHYDYYRDNCSTRVRDALDRALGGRIRQETIQLATGKTYRFHTRRLTANDPLIYTGLLLALGQPVDRPISAWEEMFLPLAMRDHLRRITVPGNDGRQTPLVRSERTLFESSGTPPPDRPPFWLPVYLGIGVVLGSVILGLGATAHRNRFLRAGLIAVSGTWSLLVGMVGLVLAGLWGLTDHTAAYHNENLLQANLLALGLLWWAPKAARGLPSGRRALVLAAVVVGLSLLGLVLKLLPAFYQVNGEIIALALPIHLGVAGGLWRMHRSRSTRELP